MARKRIVVVDDDRDTLDLVRAYFKAKDYEITAFMDAESAINEAQRSGDQWDVLLTDLVLPKMSGIEFVAQMKVLLPNLPITLITSSRSVESAVEAIQKGAYDFIVKPIHLAQLQISIERAMRLKALKTDISELRSRVRLTGSGRPNVIGRSPKFLEALDIAKRVAGSAAHIFISGESGTGKEIFARFIHDESKQRKGPFIAINCSAIPENLLESELFGHAKGAFTGAQDKKIGMFEAAQNGTLFLDEIGDLTLSLQAKLLRVLQEKKIKRVGENQFRPINCRIISATHEDLSVEVENGRFREDLFFRLNVIPIYIPPLRERTEDILPLAEAFLRRFALENGSPARSFSKEAIKCLFDNGWRGNVRELENTVERAVVLSSQAEILVEDLMPLAVRLNSHKNNDQKQNGNGSGGQNGFHVSYTDRLPLLDEVILQYIHFAVEKNGGAQDRTAKEIGINRKTLYRRVRSRGLNVRPANPH